jgi:hypothetical protein
MDLNEYFANASGLGVLSTAGADGSVNAAIYANLHVFEDGTVAVIMNDRLTHHNLEANPHAHYLFKEDGDGYQGVRLRLTKVREEHNTELLQSLRRRRYAPDVERQLKDLYLVFFEVDQRLPLVGV